MKLIGLDPGLQNTGWGIIQVDGNRLQFVADGTVHSDKSLSLAERLLQLHEGLAAVMDAHKPDAAAVAFGVLRRTSGSDRERLATALHAAPTRSVATIEAMLRG